jgi:hypothetical protein
MIDDPARDAGGGRRARKAELLVRAKAKRVQMIRVLGGGREEGRRSEERESRARVLEAPARRPASTQRSACAADLRSRCSPASPSPRPAQLLSRNLAGTASLSAPLWLQ